MCSLMGLHVVLSRACEKIGCENVAKIKKPQYSALEPASCCVVVLCSLLELYPSLLGEDNEDNYKSICEFYAVPKYS